MERGYKSILDAVKKDTEGGGNCFNENGCDKKPCKCFHHYCDKFAWIMKRADHYAEKMGITRDEMLEAWEKDRTYWHQNYYQEAHQPLLDEEVYIFDTLDDLKESMNDTWKFRCPACKGISTDPYTCNSGEEMSKGKICDWKSYGLFRASSLAKVFVKSELKLEYMFMPIIWEEKNDKSIP